MASHWSKKYGKKCRDGGKHDGKLELVTWSGTDEDGDKIGWGACLAEESDDLKKKFETEYNSNEEAFYKYWPQGFRWTCCGMPGDTNCCDHHGTGSKPCTCDFCVGGMPLTTKILAARAKDLHAQGLTLSSGPDPRSYNQALSMLNSVMRSVLGMDD